MKNAWSTDKICWNYKTKQFWGLCGDYSKKTTADHGKLTKSPYHGMLHAIYVHTVLVVYPPSKHISEDCYYLELRVIPVLMAPSVAGYME